MTEPSPLLKLTHLGFVVRDIDKAVKTYESLGIGPFKRFSLPSPEFKFNKIEHFGKYSADHKYEVAYANAGPVGIEIFQCIGGDNIPQRFLDEKGEGLWHYGYDVEDMDKTIEWMAERGYGIIGSAEYPDGTRMVYFDTREDLDGIVFQAHENVEKHLDFFEDKSK
jgi:catechol 2,3-dioxygenase-like lactoylglutathione lyase family enzyme